MCAVNNVQQYYNQVGADYNNMRSSTKYRRWVSRRELDFVMKHVPQGAKVLEIGPGAGYFTERLVEKAQAVTAIDISESMLAAVRDRIDAPNLKVLKLDINGLENAPGFGEFDTVVCMRVLPHVANMRSSLTLIRESLQSSGNAIFDLWNANSPLLLARKLLRRHSRVFTQYLTSGDIEEVLDQIGLDVHDRWGWGYPRLGPISFDVPGFKLAPKYAWSTLFNVRSK